MILLLALCQPYRKKFFNYVDLLIFTDLSLLNSMSLYLLEVFKERPALHPPYYVFGLQVVLMFLPFLYALTYVTWMLVKKWKGNWPKEWSLKKTSRLDDVMERECLLSRVTDQAPNPPNRHLDSTEVLLARAEDTNRYKKKKATVSVVGLNHHEDDRAET